MIQKFIAWVLLLTYVSYNTISQYSSKKFGIFLKVLSNEWFNDDNPEFNVRILIKD